MGAPRGGSEGGVVAVVGRVGGGGFDDADGLAGEADGDLVGVDLVLQAGAVLASVFGDAVTAGEHDADVARFRGRIDELDGLVTADRDGVRDRGPVDVGAVFLADAVADEDAGVGVGALLPPWRSSGVAARLPVRVM